MNPDTGLTNAHRQAVANELSKLLADETILYIKTKNAHWNVTGADFYDKHLFFETQFAQLDAFNDSIAERIRTIGHFAPATLKSYLALTSLAEDTNETNTGSGYIKVLLIDHEIIIRFLHQQIKPFADVYHDPGTSDFITGLMESHEKMAWFLRSHLK